MRISSIIDGLVSFMQSVTTVNKNLNQLDDVLKLMMNTHQQKMTFFKIFFFYQCFLSRTLTVTDWSVTWWHWGKGVIIQASNKSMDKRKQRWSKFKFSIKAKNFKIIKALGQIWKVPCKIAIKGKINREEIKNSRIDGRNINHGEEAFQQI